MAEVHAPAEHRGVEDELVRCGKRRPGGLTAYRARRVSFVVLEEAEEGFSILVHAY